MPGKFQWKPFSEINLADQFFNTLKTDYPGNAHSREFCEWFRAKALANEKALVYLDDSGIGAFVSLKQEAERIEMKDGSFLPALERTKIRTIKIDHRNQGQRLGEGALGLILWYWQKTRRDQIYVTVFDKHEGLINLLLKFGFGKIGYNLNEEGVYLKDRRELDYSDPYKSFPFINPEFNKAGYVIIRDYYHDTMFPYSELKNTLQESVNLSVANGICKIYVGTAFTMPYEIGEPVFIYRQDTQDRPGKRYRSCLTSYCVITDIIRPKISGQVQMGFDDLLRRIGNKSVYNETELHNQYQNSANMNVYEMLYFGYFGEGHNINMDWLDQNGYWPSCYPANGILSRNQFKEILSEANVDVQNVIID